MKLKIDSQPCDFDATGCVLPGYDARRLAEVEACREGHSLRLTLPSTPRNDALLAFACDPHAAGRFNEERHTAELSHEGAVLLAGTVRLLVASGEGYTLEVRDGGAGWARQAALRMFNALGVAFTGWLTPTAIRDSWTDPSLVRFLPVHRDEYPQQSSPTDLQPARRLLSVDDYHPFLHVATLVDTIFSEAGYRIESRFFASDFFRSLYMSGAYSSRDVRALEARMGFRVRRLGEATAAADHLGRVHADPAALSATVGNVVETATPQSVDADGATVDGLYNHGNCFAVEAGKIRFRPTTEVSVGFEYYLRYTTDHRILTRERLEGFDSFYLGTGADLSFVLTNRYTDRRERLLAGSSYRAIVFDHAAGAEYRLYYRFGGVQTLWAEFATRSHLVTTPSAGSVAAPTLRYRMPNGPWSEYTGDWALYDGHVGETGRTTVEVRVHTAAERITPTSPKRFDDIYFYGAREGMTLTLHKECALRPLFSSAPGYGERVTFADAAQHRVRQSKLLEALAHLFNLRFFTEPATRTVWIEPADDFFGAGQPADWRDRTDFSEPVVVSDLAAEVHERRTWRYREGDGAVARHDAEAATPFGAWNVPTASYAAKEGEEVLANPLFSPTLNAAGHFADAPSALLPVVGDRDAADDDGSNFTPRIVRYCGLRALPAGERWEHPAAGGRYPFAAFHFAGDAATAGFTLCFEDRDGQRGLHRYYDRQAACEASRQRIGLTLRLEPHEYEALFTPGTGAPDIRSTFLIETGQGAVRASLRSIDAYDPAARKARCTFTRLPED